MAEKKKSPFWSLCLSDFFGSTTCASMTGLQEAVYLKMLARCYDMGGRLPADSERLRELLRIEKLWWKRNRDTVCRAFEKVDDTGCQYLTHPRIDQQIAEVQRFRRLMSAAGRKGGLANAKRRSSQAKARLKPPSPSPSLEPTPPDDGLGISAESEPGGEGVFYDGGEDPEAWRWLEHLASTQQHIQDPLGYVISMRRKGRHPRDLGLPWWREPGTPEPELTRMAILLRLKNYRGRELSSGGVIGWRQEWGKWVIDNGVADVPLEQYNDTELRHILRECEGTLDETGGEKRKEVMPTDEK